MNTNADTNDWPYAEILDEHAIMSRVDFAKIATHNSIISSSNPEQIFIEDILNIFIAIVQHPLNFVFFNEERDCLFHFCKDPIHKKKIDKVVKRLKSGKENILFDFFNYEVKEKKRYVALLYMDTKNGGEFFPIERSEIMLSADKPLTELHYISICAELFFSDRWKSFSSYSSDLFLSGINHSIDEMTLKYIFGNSDDLDNDDSNSERRKSGQKFPSSELLTRLSRTLLGASPSSSYVSKLTYELDEVIEAVQVPDTLLAFRDYGVPERYQRYNNAYNYKTRFIVTHEDDSTSDYQSILDRMRIKYPMDRSGDPKSCIQKLENSKRVPYSKITLANSRSEEITRKLDIRFWQMLHDTSLSSIDFLKEVLEVPVSSKARSLVDPVYQTGLIHYNRIFENAGLDRLDGSSIKEDTSQNSFSIMKDRSSIDKDLLRIVLLYYLITDVLSCNEVETVQPEDILCVMFPIKIKGVCWAVAIQPYYAKRTELDWKGPNAPEKHRHGDQHAWISRYLLSTAYRRRLFLLIDSTCWEFALQTVIRSVAECCLSFFKHECSALEAENKLNDDMLLISAYLPYSFPKFVICTINYAEKHGYAQGKCVLINKHSGKLCLAWDLADNPFYTPTQDWKKRSTRSFRSSIELGINLSFDKYYEKKKMDLTYEGIYI